MFRGVGIFFVLLLGGIFGWVMNDISRVVISNPLDTPKEIVSYTSTPPPITIVKKNIEDNSTKIQPKISKSTKAQIKELLGDDLFYDALSLYLYSQTNSENRQIIEDYLSELVPKDTTKAIELIGVFMDNEPSNTLFEPLLEAYISIDKYKEAIDLIISQKDNYISQQRDIKLSKRLEEVSKEYIKFLDKKERYKEVELFLEEMINSNNQDEFYSKEMALYQQTLQDRQNKNGYEYKIPLTKIGEHFIAKVRIDDIPLNLMLDTGASYIFVDENKISPNMQLIRDDLILNTANGEVVAKIYKSSRLNIGELEIQDIQIAVAPFERENIDGLLGMNFFKRFKFVINQDESILYLKYK